jgi:monoterpene epsilon-lactone hydrolase
MPEMKQTDSVSITFRRFGYRLVISIVIIGGATFVAGTAHTGNLSQNDADGTFNLPAVALPPSSFLDDETRAALRHTRDYADDEAASRKACPSMESADASQAPAIRKCETEVFYRSALYRRIHDRYPVAMIPKTTGGVYTEVFTPMEGIASKNENRVLINVHGGGFIDGARMSSHLESIPIASVGRIKVISIDYRQAPEYSFPAASEDVAAVYRELLKSYKPNNIGIYGCSAGGLLAAEALAWLQKEKLPMPGAIGMFCAGAGYWTEGDSGYIGKAQYGGIVWGTMRDNPYFRNTDPNNPLAFPVRSHALMGKFPPSILIAATRDPALSSVVHTHSVLINQGVDAELHVWEGLGHAFFLDPDFPQSREVYAITVKFFDTHLGK